MSKETSIKIHPISSSNTSPLPKSVGQLSVDIYHTTNEIVIMAPIAGVTKDDITLEITKDVLVIRGIRPSKEEIPEENYYTHECFWGDFSRSIVLPLEADIKNISASFDNNVLEIRIPRTEVEHTKIIKIKA